LGTDVLGGRLLAGKFDTLKERLSLFCRAARDLTVPAHSTAVSLPKRVCSALTGLSSGTGARGHLLQSSKLGPVRAEHVTGDYVRTANRPGGQHYEVRYEAGKTCKSASAVKKTVKTVGNSRKRVEKSLRK
jgi:hypothetical protein